MNFTDIGLARIKEPAFLKELQQCPDFRSALVFLTILACLDEPPVIPSKDEVLQFIGTHHEELIDLLVQARDTMLNEACCTNRTQADQQ